MTIVATILAGRRHSVHVTALSAIAFTILGLSVAPSASANSADSLRAAVAAARGTACGPLRSNSVADQAADAINETTDRWLRHASRAVPATDALPLLKDLGYGGSKAAILSGAAASDGDSIKALLLQGFATIPNCSYTDFGVSAMYNDSKGLILTTVVLAG